MESDDDSTSGNAPDSAKPLEFPSLDDSALWQEDAPADAVPARNEVAPLDIVRERFPRIAKAIELMWGSRELDGYLGKLVITDRENREGFPPEVLNALLRISREHAQAFVFHDEPNGTDPYQRHAFRKK